MKHGIHRIPLIIFFLLWFAGCINEWDTQPPNVHLFEFSATVMGKGYDCGDIYLIALTNMYGDSTITDDIYYAENLSEKLKVKDLPILLNCRPPGNGEITRCTAFGPGYSHVYVINAFEAGY